jgi:hypothetical protein
MPSESKMPFLKWKMLNHIYYIIFHHETQYLPIPELFFNRPSIAPSYHEIDDSNDSLTHQAFSEPIHILDGEVLNCPRRVGEAKLHLQRFPVAVIVGVEDVPHVDGQGAAMRKDLVAARN